MNNQTKLPKDLTKKMETEMKNYSTSVINVVRFIAANRKGKKASGDILKLAEDFEVVISHYNRQRKQGEMMVDLQTMFSDLKKKDGDKYETFAKWLQKEYNNLNL